MWQIIKKMFVIRSCGRCGSEKEVSSMLYALYNDKPTLVCRKCDKELYKERYKVAD